MEVQIRVTDHALGSVLGDLSARGGRVLGTSADGHFNLVTAEVAQRSMHAYGNDLRALSGGRGMHTETFSHYENMPADAEQKVIAESKKSTST